MYLELLCYLFLFSFAFLPVHYLMTPVEPLTYKMRILVLNILNFYIKDVKLQKTRATEIK